MVTTAAKTKDAGTTGTLDGKVALITGAGSGIGAAAASLFADRGAAVGALSHTPDEVREIAEKVRSSGGRALALAADVRDRAALEGAFRGLAGEFGGVDVVVANAGINGVRAPVEGIREEEFRDIVDTNLLGTFLTIQLAVPHLKKRRGGSIIVCSSVDGNTLFNDPGSAVYAASKAGQVAMTKVLAIELAAHGIRINAVLPGSIKTEIDQSTEDKGRDRILGAKVDAGKAEIPLTRGKPGTAEQVAKVMAFLASDDADHVTGATIVVDGGQSLVTGTADRVQRRRRRASAPADSASSAPGPGDGTTVTVPDMPAAVPSPRSTPWGRQ